jgi:hypothetical protein
MKKNSYLIITIVAVLVLILVFSGRSQESQQEAPLIDIEQERSELSENVQTFCYQYESVSDNFSELTQIQLIVDGATVVGEKRGSTQSGEFSIGYEGGFSGTLTEDGTVNVINTTSIAQAGAITAEERYTFINEELTEYRYAYKEDFQENILRIDESIADNGLGQTFPMVTQYSQVDCEDIF